MIGFGVINSVCNRFSFIKIESERVIVTGFGVIDSVCNQFSFIKIESERVIVTGFAVIDSVGTESITPNPVTITLFDS